MNVTCIMIEGENVIIATDRFDWLCAQAVNAEKLVKVAEAAEKVVAWDWSDNDVDCVADMSRLRDAVEAL